MEYKFEKNKMDLRVLRKFCEHEGEKVEYRKGDAFEHEGEPARWLAYVSKGCFKYVTRGYRDGKEHFTWFSLEGEFVVDYPTFLYGQPSQATIEAMTPSCVWRVSGQQLERFFNQSIETMRLRAVIAEHILFQFRSCYLDLHCATARERYEMLMQRCPGIALHLDLKDLASFLNVTPKTISMIRKDITFGKD